MRKAAPSRKYERAAARHASDLKRNHASKMKRLPAFPYPLAIDPTRDLEELADALVRRAAAAD